MNKKGIFFSEKTAAAVISILGVGFLAFLTIKYLLPIFIPFVLAWLAALAVRPGASVLHKRIRLPERALRVVLLVVLLSIVFGLAFLLISRLFLEAEALLRRISEDPSWFKGIADKINDFVADLRSQFPLLSEAEGAGGMLIEESLVEFLRESTGKILSYLTDLFGSFLMAVPGLFFSISIFVIAAVYFALDLPFVHKKIEAFLPASFKGVLLKGKKALKGTVFCYIRAYALLALLTFFILIVGFSVLRVKYALLLAFLFTLIDVLPVLGVGTMLIPWGVFQLMKGNFGLGMGLLVLFGVATIARQFLEPKIIGKHMGIHPLFTLFLMYFGFCLFGVGGLITAPLIAVLVKSLWSAKDKDKEGRAGG